MGFGCRERRCGCPWISSPNFGPALSGNVLVKPTWVAGDSYADNQLDPSYVLSKFFKAFPSHRTRITFYVRKVVDSPATFSWYRQVNGFDPVFSQINGLSTTSWTKVEAFIGTHLEGSYGAVGIFQDVQYDPGTALPILPTQRGAIAISNLGVADCGPYNSACSVDGAGVTVCGVSISRDLPAGHGYVSSIRWGRNVEPGEPTPVDQPVYDDLHRNRLSGSADQNQQWALRPANNPNARNLRWRNPGLCSQMEPSSDGNIIGDGLYLLDCPGAADFYVTDTVSVNRASNSVDGKGMYRIRSSNFFRNWVGGGQEPGLVLKANGCLAATDPDRVQWKVCDRPTTKYAQAWTFETSDPSGAVTPNPLGSIVANNTDVEHRAIGKLHVGRISNGNIEWGGTCSATYVRKTGDNRGAVVSANHCTTGDLYAFSPGYSEGQHPYGVYFFTAADIHGTAGAAPDYDVFFASFSNRFTGLSDAPVALGLKDPATGRLDRKGPGQSMSESGVVAMRPGFGLNPPGTHYAYGYPISMGYSEQLVLSYGKVSVNLRTLLLDTLTGGGASGGPILSRNIVLGVRSQGGPQNTNGIRASYSRLTADAEALYAATTPNGS